MLKPLSHVLRNICEDAIKSAATVVGGDQDVWWDLSLTLVPDGDGNPTPVYVLVVKINGALVGDAEVSSMILPAGHDYQPADVTPQITQLVEGLFEARSQKLTQRDGSVTPASQIILQGDR